MQLKEIKIVHFGQLSDLNFKLPSSKINIFFGKNESGKSTTVAFIKQILFGFHLKSNKSPFFEDYVPLEQVSPMGGSLIFEDEGDEYVLERLWAKGDKTKLGILKVKRNGEIVPENLFFDKIQKIDGSFYTDSFIFNQDMLGQITSLSKSELLERIYYLGAAESSKLLEIRDNFSKKASTLFKRTGRKPEVNQILNNLEQDRQRLSDLQGQAGEYQKVNFELSQEREELHRLQSEYQKVQEKSQEQKNLLNQSNNYQRYLALKKKQKKIVFDENNYHEALQLNAQIKNLNATITTRQSQTFDDFEGVDVEKANYFIQKRAEVLQWRSQKEKDLQDYQQFQNELKQQLAMNPNLDKFQDFTLQDIKQLSNDYLNLPSQSENQVHNSEKSTGLIVGVVVATVGLLLLIFSNKILGSIVLVAGILTLIYDYFQRQKEAAVIQNKKKQIYKEYQNFESKYGFDATRVNLDSLKMEINSYILTKNRLRSTQANLDKDNRQLEIFAQKLAEFLNQNIIPDYNNILKNIDQLEDSVNIQKEKINKQERLRQALKDDENRLTELKLDLQHCLSQAKVENLNEYQNVYHEFIQQSKLNAELQGLKNTLGNYFVVLDKQNLNNENIVEQIHGLQAKITEIQKKISKKQAEIAESKIKLEGYANSDQVFVAEQNLANTESKFRQSSSEYLAYFLASHLIGRALDIASNDRFPKMLKAAKEYFSILTNERYKNIVLDRKISVERYDDKKIEVQYLSRGTAEQLYFALKLAFIEQIQDKINLPILIDDSFVNFDQGRIDNIKKLLNKIGQKNQVLIFTAQENLAKNLSGHVLEYPEV